MISERSCQRLRNSSSSAFRCSTTDRAAFRQRNLLERIFALAVALPLHAFASRLARMAAANGDLVGHHKSGVEAHAELADQSRVGLSARRTWPSRKRLVPELAMVPILAITSSRVMPIPLSPIVMVRASGIPAHVDMQLAAKRRISSGCAMDFKTKLVARIRSVGDQLAQEDFLVRIKRVRDQMQNLGDFGFEFAGFSNSCCVHGLRLFMVRLIN